MKIFERILCILMLAFVAACGGGGGSAGSSLFDGGGGSTGGGATPTASDLVLTLSPTSLSASSGEGSTATVTALDANRNTLAGVPVTLSVDNGGIVTASGTVTDASGAVTGVVGIGSDRSGRTITVTARSGSLTRTAALLVTETGTSGQPVLRVSLSSAVISSASPATVTAVLTDAQGVSVPGQVVEFKVLRGLATTNVGTALTDAGGRAVVVMAPASPTSAGADEVTATVSYAATALSAKQGFQVNATNVSIAFAPLASAFQLAEYGQTSLTVNLTGASVGVPVNVAVTSSCLSQGKASISPSSFTATSASVSLLYKDNGCGALQGTDQITASVVGAAAASSLTLPLSRPGVSSLAFVGADPETIYLKGSGFAESSTVTFEVRDAAGNPLPEQEVSLVLLTGAGGVTMEGQAVGQTVKAKSNALGRVSARLNSGSQPTPVRVQASIALAGGLTVSTVSSNLSVAVGLPSQLNFSLSQSTINIEGYNIDGTANSYSIIASDRSGNPVPAGTSINFVVEAGQIEAIKRTALVGGLARASANFISSEPRPLDGRVTVVAYSLGEESFIDQNGNNTYDAGEPFQDLGDVFKDRLFDGAFDAVSDEFISVAGPGTVPAACGVPSNALLALTPSIPSRAATCDGGWSGAGKVYVRRAVETVFSTSAARPLWTDVGTGTVGLAATCSKVTLQTGPSPGSTSSFTLLAGDTWFGDGANGTLGLIVADANPVRFNPMAAGTTVAATTPTAGLTVTLAGSPVPSTSTPTAVSISYSFTDPLVSSGVVNLTFRSPSGVATVYAVGVSRNARTTSCLP